MRKAAQAERCLLPDVIDDSGFFAEAHEGRPNLRRLFHDKAAEKNRSLNVAHCVVFPPLLAPIRTRDLMQSEDFLAIFDRNCQRGRRENTASPRHTHDIRATISVVADEIWIVQGLVESLADQILIKSQGVPPEEQGRGPLKQLRAHGANHLIMRRNRRISELRNAHAINTHGGWRRYNVWQQAAA